MREVQSPEAEAHLSQLLSAVERGESFAITRHGRAIARLVPAASVDALARRRAVTRFRERRRQLATADFSTNEILAARHEGHRA